METGHLNAFLPYQDKPVHHEDQLTRAFLILVRCAKLVEAAFLDLLRSRMQEYGIEILPPSLSEELGGLTSIETQVHSDTKARLDSESGRLVSVVITDRRLDTDHRVSRTDRIAVYDGFVKCKPDWVFVIENKPDHRNIWVEQLSSAFNETYEIEETPVVLTWAEIITRLSVMRDNGLLHDAAAALVEDFLAYVNRAFPELNPYDRVRSCQGNIQLLDRRCVEIMEQAALGQVEYHRGWHHSIRLTTKPGIKEVTLYPEPQSDGDWRMVLDLHPGDTMAQARELYPSLSLEKVRSLQAKQWRITPNLHLAFRSSGLYWMEHKPDTVAYIEHWKARIADSQLRQIPRTEWSATLDAWVGDGMISHTDRTRIRSAVMEKRYQTLNVCPGLNFQYQWASEEATRLDDTDSNAFAQELTRRVNEAIGAW